MQITNGWLDVALDGHYGIKASTRAGCNPKYLVFHGTAGGISAEGIDDFFTNGKDAGGQPVQASAHFIIGQDGTIVQGISCDMAAWANCCLSGNHASYLDTSINQNLYTISIEHCKPSADNSDALTDAQAQASFELARCICEAYSIPMRPGDANGGIIDHADIDPVNRARCPGPYPKDELWAYLSNGGTTQMGGIPQGWTDNGTILTAPNGKRVVSGFRDYILKNNWDAGNVPLEEEGGADPVEDYYKQTPSGGTRQLFNYSELGWTSERGVYLVGIGNELQGYRSDLASARAQIAADQTQTKLSPQVKTDMQEIATIAEKYK